MIGFVIEKGRECLIPVTSIFSCSRNVCIFFSLNAKVWKKGGCYGKLFPKKALLFTCLQYMSFENTAGKGEIARNEQFLLFPQCFLSIWRTFRHFQQI